MTWKLATPKACLFFQSREEAEEQASLIRSEWKVPAFVLLLTPCSACDGDREDDLSEECNGCLMEMATFYTQN